MSECTATAPPNLGSSISLKGTSQGIEIFIDSEASAQKIALEIGQKLEEAPGFFKGADVILNFDGAPPRGYLGPIEEVTERYELRIVGVHGPRKATRGARAEESAVGLVEPVLASGSEGTAAPVEAPAAPVVSALPPSAGLIEMPAVRQDVAAPAEQSLAPKMVVGPVRSGCILEVTGHLIILGDVNPGAEVRATGSIVVLGRLRGIAHAGCEGEPAFILALQLEPQQLRIGSLVARAGDSDCAPERTEIAYAKDGAIMVDNYKGRLPYDIASAKF